MLNSIFYQFGTITPPEAVSNFGGVEGGALGKFLTLIFRIMIASGGIYSLFNIVFSGYAFLSAANDPKKIEAAWAKIWQTMLGLTIMAGAFVLAAIFGKLLFGDYGAIISPSIPQVTDL